MREVAVPRSRGDWHAINISTRPLQGRARKNVPAANVVTTFFFFPARSLQAHHLLNKNLDLIKKKKKGKLWGCEKVMGSLKILGAWRNGWIAVSEQFCCGCKAMIIIVVTSPCACSRPPLPGLQNGPVKPPRFGLDATRNWGKSGLPKPGDGAGRGGGGSILSLITFPQKRGEDAGSVIGL